MTGYLDTDADTTSTVTISGIPGSLAENRYDVYVYTLSGVAGRGGSYRIVDPASGAVLKGYVKAQSPANPAAHVQVPTADPESWGAGHLRGVQELDRHQYSRRGDHGRSVGLWQSESGSD